MKKYLKYILLGVIIVLFLIFLPLDLDEIWNYGFIHNISIGLIPYKDFNMVITPFFMFLYQIPLKIFSSNILIIYIEQAIMILITYYLLEKMYKDKATVFILLLFMLWNCIYPSYNSFILFLTIILVYLEKFDKNDYIVGILLGLIILTKQSVGICILLSSIIYYIKDLKKISKRIIGLFIPIIIFIGYLLLTNSYKEFIDLCVLGLFDFGENNRLPFSFVYLLFFLSFIISIFIIKKDNKKIEYWYTLAFLSIDIPMFDIGHFNYFIIIFITFVIIPKIKIHTNIIVFVSLILIDIFVFAQNISTEKTFYYPNKVKHFEYKYITKKHEMELYKISNLYNKYKDYNIIFLSRSSYLYKLVSDKKINYFDLINRGNWGYNGEEKLYNKLKKQEDSLFVVQTSSFTKEDQTDKIALTFIKRYCKKIDEFDDFELYIRK